MKTKTTDTHAGKMQADRDQSAANAVSQMQNGSESAFQFGDNRPEAIAQRKLQEIANNSPKVSQLAASQDRANNSPQAQQTAHLQAIAYNHSTQQQPIQKNENNTGIPDKLKLNIEALSGYSMDDVKVHYNSPKPAQFSAHAYAHGNNIHLGTGQEKHLPHEAWHVVQQKQGRVAPTLQMGSLPINDDSKLEREADRMGSVVSTAIVQNKGQTLLRGEKSDSAQMQFAILEPLAAYFGVEVSIESVALAMGIAPATLTLGLQALGVLALAWGVGQVINYLTGGVAAPPVPVAAPPVPVAAPPVPVAALPVPVAAPPVPVAAPPVPVAAPPVPVAAPPVPVAAPPVPVVAPVPVAAPPPAFMGRSLLVPLLNSTSRDLLFLRATEIGNEIAQYQLGNEDNQTHQLLTLRAMQNPIAAWFATLDGFGYPPTLTFNINYSAQGHGTMLQSITTNLNSCVQVLNNSYGIVYPAPPPPGVVGTPLVNTVSYNGNVYATREALHAAIILHTGDAVSINQAIGRMDTNTNVSNNSTIGRIAGGVPDAEVVQLRAALHCSFGMGPNGCALFFLMAGHGVITLVGIGRHYQNNSRKYDIVSAAPGYPTGRFQFPGA